MRKTRAPKLRPDASLPNFFLQPGSDLLCDSLSLNSPLLQCWRVRLRDRCLHEFLWYCVPGVLVAVIIRAWLTACLPYAQFHFDTPDFLQTPYDLLHAHRLTLHNKKTFLTPLLYTLPFLLHLPALIVIPLGQHGLGTLLVLMVGALARLWFVFWRWLVVPLTVLTAIHPALLWFEHTLLAETHYVFCVVWAVLAGTLFARRAGRESFVFFLVALFFTAGSRPEGRLFLAFGVLLILWIYARDWRQQFGKLACLAVFCVVTLLATRTQQGGILLYSSLLHLAPDQSRVAPGVMDCLRPLRDDLRRSRARKISNDVVRVEKRLSEEIVSCYGPKHPDLGLGEPDAYNARRLNNLCLKLAVEIAKAHPFSLPDIVFTRFRARIDDDSGGEFTNHELQTRQYRALKRDSRRDAVLGVRLAGVPLGTEDNITRFVYSHYDENRVAWYNHLEHGWMKVIGSIRLPSTAYSPEYRLPGVPVFYLVALAGAVAMLFLPGSARPVQWTFLPTLAGVWFTVTLAGAIMPRYRFVLEPFWLVYFFAFVEAVARLVAAVRRPRPSPAAP